MKTVATMQIKEWRRPLDEEVQAPPREGPGTWEVFFEEEPRQFYCPLYDAKTGEMSMVLFYVRQVPDDYELRNDHP